MIIKENTFTYQDMMNLLSDAEIKLLIELAKYMTDDNLLYLYQKPQRGKATIDRIALDIGISRKTVQNTISSIIAKQDEMRYFMFKVPSKIKGEYFISPELFLKEYFHYDIIYRETIPRIELQARGA